MEVAMDRNRGVFWLWVLAWLMLAGVAVLISAAALLPGLRPWVAYGVVALAVGGIGRWIGGKYA
jgi:hypothetical protein